MKENINRFNYFEKILLRISLSLLGVGLFLFLMMFIFIDSISDSLSDFANIVVVLLLSSFLTFFISIFRILKYVLVVAKRKDESTIKRSIISFFTSPLAIFIYYIMLIVISFSSCTVA